MNYKNKSGTYTITNDTNGKIYYGSSQDIGIRWKDHRCALRRGDHGNGHLQNSWNKHGPAAFTFAIFDYCEIEDLYAYEQVLLDLHVGKEYCYNIGTDAKAPMRGRKHTEESKQKLKDSLKGRLGSFKGKSHSDEAKERMSKAHTGKRLSKEHVQQIVERHYKPLSVTYPDGRVETYPSRMACAKELGMGVSSLNRRMRLGPATKGPVKGIIFTSI